MAANKSERALVDEWRDVLALHARTTEYARSHGVRGFSADVLMSNVGMLKVFRGRPGHDLVTELDDGVYEVRMMFTDADSQESA